MASEVQKLTGQGISELRYQAFLFNNVLVESFDVALLRCVIFSKDDVPGKVQLSICCIKDDEENEDYEGGLALMEFMYNTETEELKPLKASTKYVKTHMISPSKSIIKIRDALKTFLSQAIGINETYHYLPSGINEILIDLDGVRFTDIYFIPSLIEKGSHRILISAYSSDYLEDIMFFTDINRHAKFKILSTDFQSSTASNKWVK